MVWLHVHPPTPTPSDTDASSTMIIAYVQVNNYVHYATISYSLDYAAEQHVSDNSPPNSPVAQPKPPVCEGT